VLILKAQIKGRLLLTPEEKATLAEIAQRLGRKVLKEVAAAAQENRILFPFQTEARREEGAVRCRERLGGLLKYYEREAA